MLLHPSPKTTPGSRQPRGDEPPAMGQGPPASRRAHACARTGARPEAPAQGPKFWVPPLRVLLVSTHSQKGTPKCWGWDHEGEVGFGVKELVLVVDLGGSGLGWFSGGRNGGSGHISGRKVGGGGGAQRTRAGGSAPSWDTGILTPGAPHQTGSPCPPPAPTTRP